MAGIGSGLSAEITATSPTQSYPVPVTVTFKKNGSNHAVSNFANDFTSSFKVGSTPELKLWLDASDSTSVVHSSGSVSLWKDKSYGGYDAIQETSADQPATGSTSTNSLNTLSFDGSGDSFILGKDLSHKNLNVFVLLKGHGFVIANNASDRFLYGDTGSGRRLYGDINGVITTSNINISSYS